MCILDMGMTESDFLMGQSGGNVLCGIERCI